MQQKYYPPTYRAKEFHCPFCGVYAKQDWFELYYKYPNIPSYQQISEMKISQCVHCHDKAYWYLENLVIPDNTTAPYPHPDMPKDILDDYMEARSIVNKSPRGAAALLRLAIQKLMKVLGESGKDLNQDIASLVEKGLPVQVQQALDILRVIGNESVHPGQLDMKDDIETATRLFELINFIVEDRISKPKAIEELYQKLPESKRKAIEERDKKKFLSFK